MAKGIIETIEDDAVEIDGVFYKLGPKVKPELIGTGSCEYSIDEDGQTAKFIRMDKPIAKKRTFGKPKQTDASNDNAPFRDPAEIIREGCLNAAVAISVANSTFKNCEKPENDNSIKVADVISTAKKLEAYVTDQVEEKPE